MHTAAATAIQTVRTSRFELVFTPIAEIGVEERFGWAVALAMRDGADIDAFVDSLPSRGLREFARRRRLVCLRHAAGSGRGAGGAHLMIDAMPDCFENPAAELEALVHGVRDFGLSPHHLILHLTRMERMDARARAAFLQALEQSGLGSAAGPIAGTREDVAMLARDLPRFVLLAPEATAQLGTSWSRRIQFEDMARRFEQLGIRAIAACVDSEEDALRLHGLGVRYCTGAYAGAPETLELGNGRQETESGAAPGA